MKRIKTLGNEHTQDDKTVSRKECEQICIYSDQDFQHWGCLGTWRQTQENIHHLRCQHTLARNLKGVNTLDLIS